MWYLKKSHSQTQSTVVIARDGGRQKEEMLVKGYILPIIR